MQIRRQQRKIFRTNKLFLLALNEFDKIQNITETSENDLTEIFFDEIIKIHKNKELINITINGKTTQGKSTVAIKIVHFILKECYQRNMTIKNIVRDQREFSKLVRNPNIENTAIVIDEWDNLEETGVNVTVEAKALRQFNEVQAQRYIHKVACSPSEQVDELSDIRLFVVQADKRSKETLCWLYYQINQMGIQQPVLLGKVIIPVGDILQKKWYKTYLKKKKEKWDLINKEGIFRPRELTYAEMILEVVQNMTDATTLGLDKKPIIKKNVLKAFRKHKEASSLLGVNDMVEEVESRLITQRSIFETKKLIARNNKERETNKITETLYTIKHNKLMKVLKNYKQDAIDDIKELKRIIQVKKRYEKKEKEKKEKRQKPKRRRK